MISHSLLAELGQKGIQLRRKDDDLLIHGEKDALDNALLMDQLRINKASLLQLVSAAYDEIYLPTVITPDMLSLVTLSQEEIDGIVAKVPGGAANVQDIYPLAPLQEGILFHHAMSLEGDPYLLPSLLAFDSRERLDAFLEALQAVITRHDALRTAIVWEGVREPLQVVWRQARLVVEEIRLAEGDAASQMRERFDGRRCRLEVSRAPLVHAKIARDEANDRWLAMLLIHHLAVDHESLRILLQEVDAHLTGQQQQLPTPIPFRNFIAQTRFGISPAEHEAFFKEMLADVQESTLPFGLADVQGDGAAIVERREVLNPALARNIRERARSMGVSASSVFHLAWAHVLSQVTGHGSVVFGTVLLGRMYGGEVAGRVLGLCTNTLPICVQVGKQSVQEALRQTHKSLSRVLRHEHASLVLAQRCSAVPATEPLFSSLLNYRHSDTANDRSRVSPGTEVLYVEERTNYPLTLSVDESSDGFAVTVQVVASQDPRRISEMMMTALVRLVEVLERTPSAPSRMIDVLPASERHKVIQQFNATDVAYPRRTLVHELFEAQAAKTPNEIAVIYEGQQLTYEELNSNANQLARYLRAQGVGPDQLVGIFVERSLEMVVGLLGILKAGGAYVPLDPSYPAERLEYMLEDAAPRVLLTQARLQKSLPKNSAVVVALDSEWPMLGEQAAGNVADEIGVTPQHLAYVIYTSGSTGRPKGVMVTHGGVVNFLTAMSRQTRLSTEDRLLAVTTLSFDIAGLEIYLPLICGAQLLLASRESASDATLLVDALDRQAVTLLQATPATWQLLIDGGWLGSPRLTALCGGEALTGDLARQIGRRVGVLWNMYGPTETTIWSSARRVEPTADGVPAVESIGRPIANTQVYILDEYQRPAPIGVVGEIYIGGVGVARGYLHRPELTSERFSKNPFGRGDPDARMYRTGDLGRWLADGNVEYLGRNDLQVKIRGFRIELGEIEAQLRCHEHVREAVVIVREDTAGDKRIVAYVTPRDEALNVEGLRTHLRAALPEYMIPAAFVSLARLPLTPNGKTDRKALPAPDMSALSTRAYEAPHGEIEQAVANIWRELLHVERVGRRDNFFELGGHSMLIMQVLQRLRRVGLSTEVRRVFDSPTLADLASALSSEAAERAEVQPSSIPPGCQAITGRMLPLIALDARQIERIVQNIPGGAQNVQDIYPLAPQQEGLVFHHLLNQQGGDLYVRSILLTSSSRERLEKFAEALQAMIDRHDALRTVVLWEHLPQPVQVVCRRATLPVEEVVLNPLRDSVEQLKQRMKPENQRLDLRQAPLMRLQIAADLQSKRWYALLQMHHLAFDHESLGTMFAEMTAYVEGRGQDLPEPVPYRNHVAQALAYAAANDAEAFFRNKLGAIDEPTAPFGLLNVRADGSGIHEVRQALDRRLTERLHGQARRLRTSAATLLHAAWAVVVARTSGRDDVVYGSTLFGRLHGRVGAEHTVGMFANTLPLRLRLQDVTAEELVEQTRRELSELMKHEQSSLAMAQRCSGIVGTAPLFSAQLNYRHSTPGLESERTSAAGLTLLASGGLTNYPIALSVDDQNERLVLEMRTDEQVDPQRMATYVSTAIESLVGALERAPQTPALALSILPDSERQQIVESFNATQAAYPADKLIHELFEEQARQTPRATALVCEDRTLTYEELNRRANQLANHLRKQAVSRDHRVALFMERSEEMVVGILGVLKAGGAYVPLDPSYPSERVAYMLEDAAPKVVLTQERLKSQLPATNATVISLDTQWKEMAGEDAGNLERSGLTPGDLAYVMYTSGSTGQPKGVMVRHGNIVNYATHAVRQFDVVAGEGSLIGTSMNFDLSLTGLYPPLICGRAVRVCAEGEDLSRLLLEGRNYSPVKLTPTHLAMLSLPNERMDGCVSTLVVGGEQLRGGALQWWRKHSPQTRIFNHYGPTETTVGCVVHEVLEDIEGPVPIGRPISNTQIYILDRQQSVVPIGVAGELYIGGAGVARGYWNRPELTAKHFIADPFSEDPEARLYKTGDLGRWRSDGTIEYLGRNDQQVKISGFRIELGEIEAQLHRHEQVREAVVIAREDAPGEKRLVAYLTAPSDVVPNVEEIRAHLKAKLPDYMLPSAFVLLEALPLTQNGKLDRKALPAPDPNALPIQSYEAPRGEIEEVLAGIWRALLRVERVGRRDSFFELGGHSLLVVQLLERLRATGMSATVRTVFDNPILATLASELGNETRTEIAVPENLIPQECEAITPEMLTLAVLTQAEIDRVVRSVPGGAKNIQDIYPLAPLQEGLLFHNLLSEEGDAYIKSTLLAVPSRAQLDALLSALQAVNDRHDLLRSAFFWEGLPQPVQVVYRHAQLPVEESSLDPDRDSVEQMRARMAEPLRIDIRMAPLTRIQVARDARSSQWYVLLQRHHLISDHVGTEMMISELTTHLAGRAEQLKAPVAYRRFVGQALMQPRTDEAEKFFRSKLGTVDEPTAPFGLLNVHGDGSDIEEARRPMANDLAKRVRAIARRLGVSAATTIHAAWALVMAKTSGRDEIVFGSVLSGRMKDGGGVDGVMGMFVNTLPLRIQLKDCSAEQLVTQTQREIVELLQHERTSLALAQRCSGINGGGTLFTAVLNYRHTPARRANGLDADASAVRILGWRQRTNYPFMVAVDDLGEDFAITAQTERSIAPERMIEYVQTAIESLVGALERAPQTPALALSILPDSERQQIVESFNATQAAYPADKLIHELFEEQARQTPRATALVCEDRTLTYEELNRRANQLANHLRKQAVSRDHRVALFMERSEEMVVGILGVLKAGGAYVPLDPSYPSERVAYMLEDAAPKVVLTQERLKSQLPATNATVISLDTQWKEMAGEDAGNLERSGLTPGDLAYVMYTSGSTGQPKGVMVRHGNIVNYATHAVRQFDVVAGEGSLIGTSMNFDLSLTGLYPPLICGRAVRVCAEGEDLSRLLLEGRNYSPVKLTPTHLAMLSLPNERMDGCVSTLVVGGEQLRGGALQWWRKHSPQTRIFNHYGPTETTVGCVVHEVLEDIEGPVPIGRPISNTQIYILDRQQSVVPIGVAGELYIGGAGVARGYWNRPELTAKHFIANPFSEDPEARLYKTGDLGRWRSDGTIEYLGRNDQQVKISGFRIELGEIEAQLHRHEQVREAVVIAREDAPGEKRLVAYLTAPSDVVPNVEEIRAHLKAKLPDYMLPSAFVLLEALPLTQNGKLDRKALPAPDPNALPIQSYEAPRGEIEEAIADIWRDLLRVERVGRHDNFLDVGGHSLMAIQLTSRIRQVLGRELTLRELFARPTVQALARQVSAAKSVAVTSILRADRNRPLPLSWAQQRLWFIDQLEGNGAAYHLPGAIRLHGVLNRVALQAALDTIVTRHEVLRTVFLSGESPVQVIAPEGSLALQSIDLSAKTKDEREAEVKRQASAEAQARFDLSVGPLIRGRLIRLSNDEHVLLMTTHHIVSDGWSIGILVRELAAVYSAYCQGLPSPLADLSIQYADYAVWQREWLQGEVLQDQLDYWKRQLVGAPPLLALPTDRPRPPAQSYRGNIVGFSLSAELSSQLKALSRRHDVTLFMTLYAGFAILLSRVSGQEDLVIGTPVANRQRAEIEDLIGFFVNTLALRVELNDSASVSAVLERVKAMTLAAYSHQEMPFEQVVEAVQPPRNLGSNPLFQVMLVLQNTPQAEFNLPGLTIAPLARSSSMAKFDITASLQEIGDRIVGEFNYASDLFDRATIEQWVGYFNAVLTGMVQDAKQSVGRIALLSEGEQEVRRRANATEGERYGDSLQGKFVENAMVSPERIALQYGGGQMTYGELLGRSSALAERLILRGAQRNELVAVVLDRGWEQVVAVLGILLSGAAYLPIDPRWPAQRRANLLEQGEARIVVTRRELEETNEWPGGCERVCVSSEDSFGRVSSVPAARQTVDDLAYVIFTSGSTGTPKGVVIDHKSAVNTVLHINRLFGIGPEDKVLAVSELSFDLSVYDIFGVLAAGGTVVIPEPALARDPNHWLDMIKRHGVTVWNSVPQLMSMLVEVADLEGSGGILPLRLVLMSGDWIPVRLPDRIKALSPMTEVISLGGATEGSVWSIYYPIGKVDSSWESIPYGKALPNQHMYVLNEQLEPCPERATGDIYIGGMGVALGYWKNEVQTQAQFMRHPRSGERIYKTGDLGRFRSDGNIEFLGRDDKQVKIRGFRIELGEIESQLNRHPAVKEAVVIVREDTPGEKRLAGYFTASAEAAPVEELRNHLKEHLPDYMVPNALVLLDALPLTPNGKLDRNALPMPGGRPSNEYVPPITEAEKRLIDVWKDVLGIDSVGVTDNFFAIGGHSLVAVKMLRRIHQAIGAEITLRDIFRFPTVSELSAAMAKGLQSLQPQENPCLIRHGSLKPIFFVHAITGEADVYVALANLITVDAPAYGLHILDQKPRIFRQMSMSELALHHVQAIQKVQRQGPYRLAGYSAGGLLAYAIACELRKGGEQVEFVGLIDTNDVSDTPASDDISVVESVRLSIMQYNPGLEERVYQEITRMEADDTAQTFFSRSQEAGYIPEKITFSDIVDRAEYLSILLSMARAYTPPPLDAAVHLFVCADTMKRLRWKEEITKTWTRHQIGGNHMTLIHPPFLAGLAGIMSSQLKSMT